VNRTDLRDFAQSILRLDDERIMWWEEKKRVQVERDQAGRMCDEARAERDAARSELAGVAAQRDAHLTRSVELATRVTELEARLAAAPVEDGFRVGDLVVAYDYAPEPIARFVKGFAQLDKAGLSIAVECLTRKPVEVGDTVRCVSGAFAGRTGTVVHVCFGRDARVQSEPGGGCFTTEVAHLVAVAP